jgi:AcrR family transcriptional regulator
MLADRESVFEANLKKVKPAKGETRADVEKYFRDKYERLKAFLRQAMDRKECQATIRNGHRRQLEMPMPRGQFSASWAALESPNRIPLRRAASSARTLFISRPNSMIKLWWTTRSMAAAVVRGSLKI